MDPDGLREILRAGPLVADGGTGTALLDAGAPIGSSLELLNLERPGLVAGVHRGFADAGAGLILTNTFGANRYRLARHGISDRVAELCTAAVSLARDAAGSGLVGGSVGPLGVRLAPFGRVSAEEALDAYAEQIAALAGAGADVIAIETQTDVDEAELALRAAKEVAPDLAVLVSMTFMRDDRTFLGSEPTEAAHRLSDAGATVIGVNCGEGPEQAVRILRSMRERAAGTPLLAEPNAGRATRLAGRLVYPATASYVAEHAEELVAVGASIVGGCCGIGPEHIRAIADALRTLPPPAPAEVEPGVERVTVSEERPPPAPTGLASKLANESFVIAVELEPPRSPNPGRILSLAESLAQAGADVVDVADTPMAKMRMSPWALCRLLQEESQVETVLHFPTRGRNLLRVQGDLLAAHALGIRNLFVCLGDPVAVGDHPQASDVADLTATGTLTLVTTLLNEGVDSTGASLGEATGFFVGAALAPELGDPRREARLLARKVDAGARFVLSQPVFEAGTIAAFRRTYEQETGRELEIPILAGVVPLVGSRHAEFLHNEVPGVFIPETVRKRLRASGDEASAEGLRIAVELGLELREGCAGVYVIPQLGRFDLVLELVDALR